MREVQGVFAVSDPPLQVILRNGKRVSFHRGLPRVVNRARNAIAVASGEVRQARISIGRTALRTINLQHTAPRDSETTQFQAAEIKSTPNWPISRGWRTS